MPLVRVLLGAVTICFPGTVPCILVTGSTVYTPVDYLPGDMELQTTGDGVGVGASIIGFLIEVGT